MLVADPDLEAGLRRQQQACHLFLPNLIKVVLLTQYLLEVGRKQVVEATHRYSCELTESDDLFVRRRFCLK